ncbi:hypothetical protein MKW94_022224, partial [Papaver nudicaule]|nr:hypothetical protein [Papaver nudicaule]
MMKLRISEKLCHLLGLVHEPSPYRSKRIGSALIFGFWFIIGASILILTAIIFLFPTISSSLMNPLLQNNLNRYYHKISSSTSISPPPASSSSPMLFESSTENSPQTGNNSSGNVSIDLPEVGEPVLDTKDSLSSTMSSNFSSRYSNISYGTGSGGDDSSDGHCDIYEGEWVRDVDREPYYPLGSCPYIEKQPFDCYFNGKRDNEYLNWHWQWKSHPRNTGCTKNIP